MADTITDSQATDAGTVVRTYFEAVAARDLDGMAACWQPGGSEVLVGLVDLTVPEGLKAYFGEIFAAFPDFDFTVEQFVEAGDTVTVRWAADATFAGPGSFMGVEPTGARIRLAGCDVLTVRAGKIVSNIAYSDAVGLLRQFGLLPPADSSAELRMKSAFNAKTRVAAKLAASEPERVADGVWLIRGGFPAKTMNVYLIEDDGQITVFDAGIKTMAHSVAAAAARLGGIKRVVLGHAHADHRGSAPRLGAPVYCHPADRADAEGDGGDHYFHLERLPAYARPLFPWLLKQWDGGPVQIAGTVEEGDEIAGFRVVHLPGHAPGMIGLLRESDRLALTSDCFYTLDPTTGRKGHPRVPHAAFNQDTEQARASIRKLAALEPAAAWPGHADPLVGDVRSQLEQAAATT
jgi:glyoxylase-like metal-dependent hydrolase (beta-lactamase superfamily II)/predicted ester cyclase